VLLDLSRVIDLQRRDVASASRDTSPANPTADFKPFVPAQVSLPELTVLPVIIGTVLGIVFAFSSVYLSLKVGLTVSASIPVAVMSITLFRWLARAFRIRPATILENNIAQTAGSAGESLAAGVAFTLPSLLLMGFEMEFVRILLVALLGGLIGVLMMIPLRHGLIVKEHGKLTYPEGTACADVLIAGEQGGTNAKTVFLGFFVGLAYAALNLIAKLWNDTASFAAEFWGKLKGGRLAFDVSPPMLGVGYIIGPRVAANMMAGGLLAFVVLVPLVHLFGDSMQAPMYPETQLRIAEMSAYQIRSAYVLYVGAGAVATGGFIALARALPSILSAFKGGIKDLKAERGESRAAPRTERDIPMSVVVGGSFAIALMIWLAPKLNINLVSAILIVLFGFFFVTVSSRITGEIGSSSNPISGMTVATLLLTCGLFVLVGWTGVPYKEMALTTAALVCVAASNGGTISQDLKTGYLVGATPRAQQISILVAVVASALVIGGTLIVLNQGHTTYRPVDFPEYRAALDSSAQKATGPDRASYRVYFLPEDVGRVQRGKYLVDDAGRLQFLVDPGVSGSFPYRLDPVSFPGVMLPISNDAPREMGNDHRTYSVVQLNERFGPVRPGRYLVNDRGEIAYAAIDLWKFDAPKAQLFRLIIDGTLGGQLPWALVLVGMFLAVIMELVGVSSLPFAVGLYLPIETSAGIFIGGMVRLLVDRRRRDQTEAAAEFSPGVLMASGLIAGGSIAGVVQSVITLTEADAKFDLSELLGSLAKNESWWPMLLFLALAALLYAVATRSEKKSPAASTPGPGA
jgi:putative OPT family oligopeptide transporter